MCVCVCMHVCAKRTRKVGEPREPSTSPSGVCTPYGAERSRREKRQPGRRRLRSVFSGDKVDDQVSHQGPRSALFCCVTQMGGEGNKEEGGGGRER